MAKFELDMTQIVFDLGVLSEEAFAEVAEQEVFNTIANTVSKVGAGKDVDGGQAKKGGYSASYRKAIEQATAGPISRGPKKGRARPLRKKGGNTTPNLRLTGELLESFQPVRIKGGAEGRFIGGHKSGLSNAGLMAVQEGNGYEKIVAFGKDDEARIDKRFADEVGKALDRMIRVGKGR